MSAAWVQENGATATFSVTLNSAPTTNNYLIAFAFKDSAAPVAASDWDTLASFTPSIQGPYATVAVKRAGASEPAAQTPFSGTAGNRAGVAIMEVSDLTHPSQIAITFGEAPASGNATTVVSSNTTGTPTLALAHSGWQAASPVVFTIALDGAWIGPHVSGPNTDQKCGAMGRQSVTGVGTTVTATTTTGVASYGLTSALLLIGPPSVSTSTIRMGVSLKPQGDTATFTAITGSVSSDYPITNLSDLYQTTKVARITPSSGAIAFQAVLTANQTIQMAALVNHSLPVGATVRVRFYSDASLATLVHDMGSVAIPDPVTGYVQTFPSVMPSPLSVRAIRVDIANAGASAVDIGGVEIAQWWDLPQPQGAQVGMEDGASDIALMGGGAWGREEYHPNSYRADWSHMDSADGLTTGVTFLKNKSLTRPYVFVEDYADKTTWPRTCFLALNSEMSDFAMRLYDRDSFALRAREYLR